MSTVPCSLAVRFKPMTCTACELSPHTVGAEEVRDDTAHYIAEQVKGAISKLQGQGAVALAGTDILLVFGDKLLPYVDTALAKLESLGGVFELIDPTVFKPADIEGAVKEALACGAISQRPEIDGYQDEPVQGYGTAPSMN